MYYKGYPIGSVEAELLYDILQTQQEILEELRKNGNPDADDECIGLTEEMSEDAESEASNQPINDIDADVPEPTETVPQEQPAPVNKPVSQKKPAQRKTAKKKTQSKKSPSKKAQGV